MPTFPEAVSEANDLGWYIYQLCQEETFWQCTLRASSGPPRRQISNGRGDSPEEAIFDALSKAPEVEPDTDIYKGPMVVREADVPDLLAILAIPRPNLQPTRRRS